MDKLNQNVYGSYEKAFKKFEENNGYSIFDLASNSDLRKNHYEKNKELSNNDNKTVQTIYDRLSIDKCFL